MKIDIYDALEIFDRNRVFYYFGRNRPDSISLYVTFVGARSEVTFFKDGNIEISTFYGDESVNTDFTEMMKLISDNN